VAFSGEKLRISCECGGEEVALSYYPQSASIELSFWEVGRPRRRTRLTYTIEQIIQLIKVGEPYTDMVLLNSKEAMKLGKKLVELAPKLAKAEQAQREKDKKSAREFARKQKEKVE